MLALLFLTGAALFGACLTRRVLRGALYAWEHALWGAVVGWMLAALAAYASARLQGRLTFGTVAWTTLFVWACAAALIAPALVRRRAWPALPGARRAFHGARGLLAREHVGLASVLLLSAPVYWRLFSSHTFAPGVGGLYSGGSAWYDLSFHAALASSFAYGENFPPAYTPLAGEPLLYPFMPDFHAATLMAAGLSMRAAFLSTALPLALLTTGIFYSFALRVARRAGAATLATLLFLLNGGLGFLELLRDWRGSGLGFAEFWGGLSVNYANDWARGIHWTNLVADTFLPQRASLYGLPAGLMILTLFAAAWRRWEGGRNGEGVTEGDESEGDERQAASGSTASSPQSAIRNPQTAMLFAAGVLAGLLPLFHTHTYVAVGLVSLFLFLMRPRRAWLAFWAPALLLAAPHLFGLASRAAGGGILRLQTGWMGAGEPSFAVYMLRNFGLPLLLALPAWWTAPRAWKSFYAAFALLFAFALTVVVSPNVFDNGKLTYYWHALNSALVTRWLYGLAHARRARLLAAPLALLLALLSVATGVAALRAESRASALLFTDEGLAAARFVREGTAPRALFLTAPTFNQPALSLAGRPLVRGATAWLWGHGHEFRAREADVRAMYAGGGEALELLSHYGVDYVYVGAAERDELSADVAFFESNLPAVYRGGGVQIYDARGLTRAARPAGAPAPRELSARVGRDPYALLEEFPRTSLFVYRLLKAAHGRAPRRAEFMEALKALGRGLYVGAPGWEGRLSANGRALAERLAGGDESRAAALLAAAVEGKADARDYDEAFVLVHFFGYLGRDPGDPPDRGREGFDYWLGILRGSGDYRSLSRAFLESDEYKGRLK